MGNFKCATCGKTARFAVAYTIREMGYNPEAAFVGHRCERHMLAFVNQQLNPATAKKEITIIRVERV